MNSNSKILAQALNCSTGGCLWMLTSQGWECFDSCEMGCQCPANFPGPSPSPVPTNIDDPVPVIVSPCDETTSLAEGEYEVRYCILGPEWQPNQPYIAAIFYSDSDPQKNGWRLFQRGGSDFNTLYDLQIPGAFPGMLVVYQNGSDVSIVDRIVAVGKAVQPPTKQN